MVPEETSEGVFVPALLISAGGRVLDRSPDAPASGASLASRAPADGSSLVDTVRLDGVERRVLVRRVPLAGGESGVMVLSHGLAEQRQSMALTTGFLGAALAVLLGGAGLLAHAIAGRALRPVRLISGLAREISEQDLHRRIVLDLPPDELGELAATVNAMLDRLEASFTSLQRFTADAAHELRAPLSLLRTEIEVALQGPGSLDEYRGALQGALAEAERLTWMADQLLLLARADAGVLSPGREQVDLVDFIEETADRWRATARRQGIEIRTELPSQGLARVDAVMLRRLLDNLVDNATRHTPRGGAITLEAAPAGGTWSVAVADTGPGIPEPIRAQLFERFWRPDRARGRETGGAGLGLSLCAAIARAHGGTITAGGAAGGGARFLVTLPGAAVDPDAEAAAPAAVRGSAHLLFSECPDIRVS
ncbi:MAG TPA: ATP-binding protein [Candidatus Dormibacteraeota bacterium]